MDWSGERVDDCRKKRLERFPQANPPKPPPPPPVRWQSSRHRPPVRWQSRSNTLMCASTICCPYRRQNTFAISVQSQRIPVCPHALFSACRIASAVSNLPPVWRNQAHRSTGYFNEKTVEHRGKRRGSSRSRWLPRLQLSRLNHGREAARSPSSTPKSKSNCSRL